MEIKLTINNQEVVTEDIKTILEAAREQGIDIPTICFHEATTANGLCRICVVDVEGWRTLQPSCVVRARKTILEMLASTMDLSDSPAILTMMDEYGADASRFPGAVRRESEVK